MSETMKDYEKELEASYKKIAEGDILTGTVIGTTEEEVILDLKSYAEGIIKAEDYSREPGFSVREQVHAGDEVTATVIREDDGNGNILMSKVEADDVLAWDKLKDLQENETVLDVVIKGIVKSGVIAYVEGVRGFIPASRLSLSYVEELEDYLNKNIRVQVLEVDKDKKKTDTFCQRTSSGEGKRRAEKKDLQFRDRAGNRRNSGNPSAIRGICESGKWFVRIGAYFSD